MSESTQIIFLKAEPRAARRETLSLQRCSLCGSSYPDQTGAEGRKLLEFLGADSK